MLLPHSIYVWSSAPLSPTAPASFVPMVYASANADGSFAGYDSTTAAAQLNARESGKRVLIFQGMLSGLFSPTPPFYSPTACLPHVQTFFSALRAAGVTQLDAVIPDVEGWLCDWQITPDVATAIVAQPFAADFLERIGYTGDRTGDALSAFVQTHRQTVQPVLASYADQAILTAIAPLRDLYGDVLIQKGSLSCPSYASSLMPQPWDAGDTPSSPMACSFAQCDEVYGEMQASYAWPAPKIAETWLTRLAVAKGSCAKQVVPWIAPKSYAGSSAFPVPWANTPAYDSFLGAAMKIVDDVMYWRHDTATAADDEAVAAALG